MQVMTSAVWGMEKPATFWRKKLLRGAFFLAWANWWGERSTPSTSYPGEANLSTQPDPQHRSSQTRASGSSRATVALRNGQARRLVQRHQWVS